METAFRKDWRRVPEEFPDWERRRLAGMRQSPRVRDVLSRIRPAAVAAALQVMARDPRFRPGPENQLARAFALVAPDGTLYEGLNLADFVRTHGELFTPADRAGSPANKTRAYHGLYAMFRTTDRRPGWKGWRPG